MTHPTEPKPTSPAMTEDQRRRNNRLARYAARKAAEPDDISRALSNDLRGLLDDFDQFASARAAVGEASDWRFVPVRAVIAQEHAARRVARTMVHPDDYATIYAAMIEAAPTIPDAGSAGSEIFTEARRERVRGMIDGGAQFEASAAPPLPALGREEVARIVDPKTWIPATDFYGDKAKAALRAPSLAKADAILKALTALAGEQP